MALTSATTALFIAPTLPTTHDETGFAAVTGWIKVAEISDMGEPGGTTTVVDFIDITTGKKTKRAGSQDFGQLSLTLARHKGLDMDELRTAFSDRQPRSFKIVYPSALGETEFGTGIITSIPTGIGNADKILETKVTIAVDDEIILVAD